MDKETFSEYAEHMINSMDTDNLILKAHILTEYALDSFIDRKSVEKGNCRFTYAHKISIAQMMGLFKENPDLKRDLVLLNKLRNSIAHNLRYDEKILEDFLESFTESQNRSENPKVKTLKNFEKVKYTINGTTIEVIGGHLKTMLLVSAMCGEIGRAGKIEATNQTT